MQARTCFSADVLWVSPPPPPHTHSHLSDIHSLLSSATQVLDTLAEVQERHEAVKELEKSLMELHQVFLDMAVLVEAQGEMLDNIEQQVEHGSGMPAPCWAASSLLHVWALWACVAQPALGGSDTTAARPPAVTA